MKSSCKISKKMLRMANFKVSFELFKKKILELFLGTLLLNKILVMYFLMTDIHLLLQITYRFI